MIAPTYCARLSDASWSRYVARTSTFTVQPPASTPIAADANGAK
jgi:hypothetical protein